MADYNKVFLMGRLTRDPEQKETSSGKPVTEFGFATNHKFKQGEEWKTKACFIEVSVWEKQGEGCLKYLKQGDPAFIEGYLQYGEWTEDGKKRNKLRVVGTNVQFLTKKDSNSSKREIENDSIPF